MLGGLRRVLSGRPRPEKSLEALAAIEDDDLCSLSETGQRLRREARSGQQRTYAARTP
jgi:hypothetical protein